MTFPINVVHVDITNQCNLSCLHCRNTFKTEKSILTINGLKDILKNIRTYAGDSFEWISLGGGEPLFGDEVRQKTLEAIDFGRQLGLKVLLTTNGVLVDESIAVQLKDVGISRVQISLDGAKRKTHEFIRGKGTFKKALNAVAILQNKGIETTLRLTYSAVNYSEIEEFVKLGVEVGVDAVAYRKVIPVGAGYRNRGILEFSRELNRKILESLPEWEKKYEIPIFSGDPLALIANLELLEKVEADQDLDKAYGGCAPGIAYLYISPEGFVKPCPSIDLIIGDLKQRSIKEIWEESSFYKRIRKRDIKICGDCKYKFICGGCRATAFAKYRDYFAPDPNCWFTDYQGGDVNEE